MAHEETVSSAEHLDSEDTKARKDVYSYTAAYPLYSVGWSYKPSRPNRVAIGSVVEEYENKVEIIELDEETDEFVHKCTFDHPYPTTKVMWMPDKTGSRADLLATSGDFLRLWSVQEDGTVQRHCMLNANKNAMYCAPLTSFDWSEADPGVIAASSIDTAVTVWQVETQQVTTQLIAHDKEVYDIAFGDSRDVFASVSADGSVRVFDLRSLDHSRVLYEGEHPLVRLSWNKSDPNYIATMAMETKQVVILDVRRSAVPVAQLEGHDMHINALDWAPHSSHLCTAGDDKQALIWDVSDISAGPDAGKGLRPILTYAADFGINQLKWSPTSTVDMNWIAICLENKLQVLRV